MGKARKGTKGRLWSAKGGKVHAAEVLCSLNGNGLLPDGRVRYDCETRPDGTVIN